MKINWKQKLSSRKFWAAIIGVVTPLLVIFNVPEMTIEQIVGIISACATLIAYILSEGYVDANRSYVADTEPVPLVYPKESGENEN